MVLVCEMLQGQEIIMGRRFVGESANLRIAIIDKARRLRP